MSLSNIRRRYWWPNAYMKRTSILIFVALILKIFFKQLFVGLWRLENTYTFFVLCLCCLYNLEWNYVHISFINLLCAAERFQHWPYTIHTYFGHWRGRCKQNLGRAVASSGKNKRRLTTLLERLVRLLCISMTSHLRGAAPRRFAPPPPPCGPFNPLTYTWNCAGITNESSADNSALLKSWSLNQKIHKMHGPVGIWTRDLSHPRVVPLDQQAMCIRVTPRS